VREACLLYFNNLEGITNVNKQNSYKCKSIIEYTRKVESACYLYSILSTIRQHFQLILRHIDAYVYSL